MTEIEKLHLKIAKCNRCNSITNYRKFPAVAHGNIHSKNMIISEAPARVSVGINKFWTGNAGLLLRNCINSVGKDLEKDFYITDVVKCWPNIAGRNRKPKPQEVTNCRAFVLKEIELLNPRNILLFGQLASGLLLENGSRMEDYHGKIQEYEGGITVYFFYHPSYILRQLNKNFTEEYEHLLIKTFSKIFNHGPATT